MPVGPSLEDRDPRRSGKTSGRTSSQTSGKNGRRSGRGGSAGRGRSIFWAVRTALGLGLFCALVAIAGLVGMFSYYGSDPKLPTLKALGDYHPKQVTRILDRNGTVIGELGTEKRT